MCTGAMLYVCVLTVAGLVTRFRITTTNGRRACGPGCYLQQWALGIVEVRRRCDLGTAVHVASDG